MILREARQIDELALASGEASRITALQDAFALRKVARYRRRCRAGR